MYPVIEVLRRHDRGVIKGPTLIEKLEAKELATRQERIFLVNVLSDYLMENCQTYGFCFMLCLLTT